MDASAQDVDDGVIAALDDLAATAEQTARDQRRLARAARIMGRGREQGLTWSQILDRDGSPGVLELHAAGLRRLVDTNSRFRPLLAAALAREGQSTRQIAARLGVTHQRISTMLNPPGPDDARS